MSSFKIQKHAVTIKIKQKQKKLTPLSTDKIYLPHGCKPTKRRQTLSRTKFSGVTGTYLINFEWVEGWINQRATWTKSTGGTWIENAVTYPLIRCSIQHQCYVSMTLWRKEKCIYNSCISVNVILNTTQGHKKLIMAAKWYLSLIFKFDQDLKSITFRSIRHFSNKTTRIMIIAICHHKNNTFIYLIQK